MSTIVNKLLLGGDKFIPEIHLTQPGFTYDTCSPCTNNKETGASRYIYQSKFDKVFFKHDLVYGDIKDLNRAIIADNIWPYKAFNIAKNQKFDGYQPRLASMVYKIFDKKATLLVDKIETVKQSKMKLFLIKN